MFSCPFDRYRYIRLPFRAAMAGDIFQKKIDELYIGIPNVFCIADHILTTNFDEQGRDHDATLQKVLQYSDR